MTTAKRDAEDTPEALQRTVADDEGRTWVGTAGSGRQHEAQAEVLFVCRDQPSEDKRVATLDVDSAEADRAWSRMGEDEVREVFRRSTRA